MVWWIPFLIFFSSVPLFYSVVFCVCELYIIEPMRKGRKENIAKYTGKSTCFPIVSIPVYYTYIGTNVNVCVLLFEG